MNLCSIVGKCNIIYVGLLKGAGPTLLSNNAVYKQCIHVIIQRLEIYTWHYPSSDLMYCVIWYKSVGKGYKVVIYYGMIVTLCVFP